MSKHRLLIIEDDEQITGLVSRVAHKLGFHMRSTCDYAEIPTVYDEFMPHVIVLDIIMPGMDGFEVLDFLHKRHSSTSIIIISGDDNYRSMVSRMGEGLGLKVMATVAKPFRVANLSLELEKVKMTLPQGNPLWGAA